MNNKQYVKTFFWCNVFVVCFQTWTSALLTQMTVTSMLLVKILWAHTPVLVKLAIQEMAKPVMVRNYLVHQYKEAQLQLDDLHKRIFFTIVN